MAEKDFQGINTIHVKPASEDITTVCGTENCTNQNAVLQKINPKHEKITQMFLARPEKATPNITEVNTPKQDVPDRTKEEVNIRRLREYENEPKVDEEEQKLKAKYEAIAQMFLARPANATAAISEVNTPKQDAPDRNKKEVKIRKAKEYDVFPQKNGPKDDEEEQKLKAKYEAIAQMFLARPASQQAQIRENTKIKEKVKRREVDKKMGKKDKQSKPSRLAGCFIFIVEWFSKKKQKRQDEKMSKKASKYRTGKSVGFCELPPDMHIYDSDECVDADASDVCKVDGVDIFFN